MAIMRCFAPGLLTGGGAPFSPADLPGVVHWWDAELSTKTGSPGDISQLNDKIGTLHLSNGTSAQQPDDNTRTLNGVTALDFDGGDCLGAAGGPNFTTNFHMFFVIKFDALADSDFIFDAGPRFDLTTNDGASLHLDGASGSILGHVSNGTNWDTVDAPNGSVGTTNTHLIEFYSIGTTKMGIRIDGNTPTENTSMSFGCASPDAFVICSRSPVGALNNLDCGWGMAVVCNQEITGADLTNIQEYCQTRWGTP